MNLKCIAVDDEPLALDLISRYIEQTPFLELKGAFSSAIEALSFINQAEIQVIFMDIQMPDLSGMELARVLDGKKDSDQTRIIFATAYHQFAIEGYKVDALDYLLKPYSYEDFLKAATKALHYFKRSQEAAPARKEASDQATDYIFLKVEYQLVKVKLNDISYVEAYKDYVKVHLQSKTSPLLSLTTLKNMQELLPEDRFLRVHRSFIVNLDQIDSVTKNTIHIRTQEISIGDNYKEAFLDFMSRWMN